MVSFFSLCHTFLALFALFIAKRLYALYNNYIAARSLNLPIVVCFESFQDPLWMFIGPSVRKFLSYLGVWDPLATDYTSIGWSQNDRFASHAKYGPAFVIVSPFENNVMVTDKDAAQELFKNWRIWIKNQDIYSMFNAYGKNVNTVIGDDWPRHRKVTSHAFKEANSKLVWGATRKQMNSLVSKWKSGSEAKEISLAEARADWEKLALHVLMSVGFRKEYEFETGVKVVEPGHKISFGEAMHTCVGSMALVLTPVIYAAARLPSFVIPAGLKRLQIAIEEVKSFLKSAVEDERKALKEGIQLGSNLISTLVQANEEEKKEGGKALALTDNELYGNLFLFNLAGHETTSSALGFAVPLLALYPKVQRWIREEIDAVVVDCGLENYTEVFPRLTRILAFMVFYPGSYHYEDENSDDFQYETQRFFSAIPLLPKYTADKSQPLMINGTYTMIPPKTWVSVNLNGLHFDPATWGSDVNEFRPSRWIKNPGAAGNESFTIPDNVEFAGWSSGPRACPGKRFSQVEFTAAISRLLIDCEVQPAKRIGDTEEQARERLNSKTFGVEQFDIPSDDGSSWCGYYVR